MIYIFLFFTLFIFLNFKYRRYNNPYKLYMIFGKKGSGKSTLLCKLALRYQKKGYIVYTNMDDMCIPDVRIIDAEKLGSFVPESKSCILLDEVGMLYDNRDFKKFKPDVRDFFKLQRHYNCVVYLASQSFDIDKKLRDLTDRMYLITSVFPWLSLARPISKRIGLVEASSQGESRIVENLKFMFITSWRFTFIPKYAKYFNSFIAPVKPFLEYKFSEQTQIARVKDSVLDRVRSRLAAKRRNIFKGRV